MRLAYSETFLRFANPISMKAPVFFVSLRPLSKSHYQREDEVERRLYGGPGSCGSLVRVMQVKP